METENKEAVVNEVQEVKKEKKRDYAVELIRIYACITVILMHLSLHIYNIYDLQVDWSRLFEKAFFTEGIPLFFMITGFFLTNGRSYKKIWKSTICKVLIPVAFYVVLSQIFYKFLVNQETFLECLRNWHLYINLPGILEAILKGNTESLQGICDHLWYIYSYVRIVIWIPVLWFVCKNEPIPNLARRIMIILQFVKMVVIDIQRFYVLPIGEITVFSLIDFEIIYVLLGYEMFKNKDLIKGNKKARWISLIGVIIVNVIRYKLEQQLMIMNSYTDIMGRATFVEWRYTSLNVITGILAFIFFYSFEITNIKFQKALAWISDKTFGIYLVHYLIIAKIDLFKFEPLGKLWQELLYLGVGLIVIFWSSVLVVIIIRKIKEIFLKCFNYIYNTLKTKKLRT